LTRRGGRTENLRKECFFQREQQSKKKKKENKEKAGGDKNLAKGGPKSRRNSRGEARRGKNHLVLALYLGATCSQS